MHKQVSIHNLYCAGIVATAETKQKCIVTHCHVDMHYHWLDMSQMITTHDKRVR